MSYGLIAMDLDETLLGHDYKISERNKNAISAAQKKGVKVTIATGRMYKSTLPYARELNIDIPFITYHGALIRSYDKTFYHYPVDYDSSLNIVEAAERLGYHINLYIDDQVHVKEENHFTKLYQTIAAVPVVPVGDPVKFLVGRKESPSKLTVIDYEGNLERMEAFLADKFSGKLTVTKSHKYFLEITHKDATKGKALKYLAEDFGMQASEVMAFGDSFNDMDMLQYAGLGVAVANGRPELKAVADLVTGTNLLDGVAEVIEEYVL